MEDPTRQLRGKRTHCAYSPAHQPSTLIRVESQETWAGAGAITASEGRPCVEFNPGDTKWTGRDGRGTGEEASRRWRPGDSRVS